MKRIIFYAALLCGVCSTLHSSQSSSSSSNTDSYNAGLMFSGAIRSALGTYVLSDEDIKAQHAINAVIKETHKRNLSAGTFFHLDIDGGRASYTVGKIAYFSKGNCVWDWFANKTEIYKTYSYHNESCISESCFHFKPTIPMEPIQAFVASTQQNNQNK